MKRISIALCTYNGAKFLEEQLMSFLRQTRLPDELVVCDDCSNDGTVEIIERFAQTAPFPIRLHRNETNLGSTKNFERAISLCAGDLIFLSDQDDVWLPEKLARVETEFEKNPQIGMVFSDALIVDENLQVVGDNLWNTTFSEKQRDAARDGKFLEVLLRHNVVTGATLAFRAEFRESFTPIPTRIPNTIHDAWIALFIAAQAEAYFLHEPTMKYRQHAGQQLGIDWRGKSQESEQNRRPAYAKSIGFLQSELERLTLMTAALEANPVFTAHRATIEKIVGETQAENREIIKHYETRKDLPTNKFARLAPIIREISSGRYHRFSKGFRSAAKDFFEKL